MVDERLCFCELLIIVTEDLFPFESHDDTIAIVFHLGEEMFLQEFQMSEIMH